MLLKLLSCLICCIHVGKIIVLKTLKINKTLFCALALYTSLICISNLPYKPKVHPIQPTGPHRPQNPPLVHLNLVPFAPFMCALFRMVKLDITTSVYWYALCPEYCYLPLCFAVSFQKKKMCCIISISYKQGGFHVYHLRRVITSQFHVYFHLWNNGMPNWEREKRLWEEEQEKEWSTVLSKNTKRSIKKSKQQACLLCEAFGSEGSVQASAAAP